MTDDIHKESVLPMQPKVRKHGNHMNKWSRLAAALLLLAAFVGTGDALAINGTKQSSNETFIETKKTNGKIQMKWIKTSSETKLGCMCSKPDADTQQAPASLVHDGINDRLLLSFESTPNPAYNDPPNSPCGPGNMTYLSYNPDNLSESGIMRQNITPTLDLDYFLYWCQGGSMGATGHNISYCVRRPNRSSVPGLVVNHNGWSSLLADACTPCGMWVTGANEQWFCCYQALGSRGDGTVYLISHDSYLKLLRPFEPSANQLLAIGVFDSKIGALWVQTNDRTVFLTQYDFKHNFSDAVIPAQSYHKFQIPNPANVYPNVTDVVMNEKYRLFEWEKNDWIVVRMMDWCFNYTQTWHGKECVKERKSISFTIFNGKTGMEEAKSKEIYFDELDPKIHPKDLDLIFWSKPVAENKYPDTLYPWQTLLHLTPDSEIVLIGNKLYIVFQTDIPNDGIFKSESRAVVGAFEVIVT